MDQDKPPKMFLRIYQQSEENIDRFLARIILPEGVNIEKGGLRGTINIAVPEETEDARNWEVLLTFKSHEDLRNFMSNPTNRAIYAEYATPIQGAEIVERHPGDLAYCHGRGCGTIKKNPKKGGK